MITLAKVSRAIAITKRGSTARVFKCKTSVFLHFTLKNFFRQGENAIFALRI